VPIDKDRKRIIRNRMKKTGESYTAARAHIIPKPIVKPAAPAVNYAELAGMGDDKIAAKTGRTWQEWVRMLDADNAAKLPHRDIAILLHGKHGVADWWAQMVTVGYERIKGLRDRGQRRGGGYETTKTKTINVPVTALFRAWEHEATRRRWLDGVKASVRSSRAPKAMRLQWPDGTVVIAGFTPKGDAKSMVALAHTKLPDKESAARSKQYWTERLESLASLLAAGRR
jgi:hypothetical protein